MILGMPGGWRFGFFCAAGESVSLTSASVMFDISKNNSTMPVDFTVFKFVYASRTFVKMLNAWMVACAVGVATCAAGLAFVPRLDLYFEYPNQPPAPSAANTTITAAMTKTVFNAPDFFFGSGAPAPGAPENRCPAAGAVVLARVASPGADDGGGGGVAIRGAGGGVAEAGACGTTMFCLQVGQLICMPE